VSTCGSGGLEAWSSLEPKRLRGLKYYRDMVGFQRLTYGSWFVSLSPCSFYRSCKHRVPTCGPMGHMGPMGSHRTHGSYGIPWDPCSRFGSSICLQASRTPQVPGTDSQGKSIIGYDYIYIYILISNIVLFLAPVVYLDYRVEYSSMALALLRAAGPDPDLQAVEIVAAAAVVVGPDPDLQADGHVVAVVVDDPCVDGWMPRCHNGRECWVKWIIGPSRPQWARSHRPWAHLANYTKRSVVAHVAGIGPLIKIDMAICVLLL
jgi:hypothetical protein